MDQLKGLLIFYAALLVFNVLFNALLWAKTSSKLYRTLCFAWLGNCLNFVVNGIVDQWAYVYHVVAIACGFLAPLMVAELFTLIVKIPYRWRTYVVIELLGIGLALVLNVLDVPPGLVVLPPLFGAAFPLLHVGLTILLRYRERLTFVSWGLLVGAFLWALHILDYAYAIDKPHLMFAGFTFAVVLTFALTAFGTAAILEILTDENTRIQMEAKYSALMANSTKLATLGEMAGGVAHEINNPLAIIQISTSLVARLSAQESLDQEVLLKTCREMESAVMRIERIVSALIAFSREGGNDAFRTEKITGILEDTLALCQEKFKERGIKLLVEDFDLSLTLFCRANEISQILLNLLNNAKDAVAGLDSKWIKITVETKRNSVAISVTDSGSGIPKEQGEKIFQPFFTTKEIGKGTGLGLSVSKGLAESHRGSLVVDETCANTRFVLVLPH